LSPPETIVDAVNFAFLFAPIVLVNCAAGAPRDSMKRVLPALGGSNRFCDSNLPSGRRDPLKEAFLRAPSFVMLSPFDGQSGRRQSLSPAG
jgi:hypothetical protein